MNIWCQLGTSIEAYTTGRPVFEPDLDQATRWAEFTRGARATGIRALFALPLLVGAARIGTMTLYRQQPGMLSADEVADAFVPADKPSRFWSPPTPADKSPVGVIEQEVPLRLLPARHAREPAEGGRCPSERNSTPTPDTQPQPPVACGA